jgi:outer membrane cobalamin receptor
MLNARLRPFQSRSASARSALGCLVAGMPMTAQAPVAPVAPVAAPAPTLSTSRDFTFAAEDQPVPVDRVAGHIQVFILEDLERSGARTLGEFLAQELPAQFQQTGGPGLPTRAYQGGARPQDTLVLLDGVRMSDPNQSAPDLSAIPLTGIVRVEILTGTDSARQGPGAQGGVVAIFTGGAGDKAASGELAGQGGSGGQSQGRALPSYGWGGGWINAGSQARKEERATDTPQGYRSATNFMAFGQRMGPVLLTLSYRNHYQGVPDPYATATILDRTYDPTREAGYRSQSGALGLRFDLAPGAALVFSAGSQNVDRRDPLPGSTDVQHTTGRATQADLAFVLGVPGFSLRIHAGGFEERGEQPVLYTGTDEGRIRHGGVGVEMQFEPAPILRFTAEAGFQSDRRRLDPAGMASSERTDHAPAFRGTMNLSLPLGFRLYAGGGQGYTAPSLPQLLLNARGGGPDLDVERNGFGFAGFGWGKGNWSGRLESNRASYRDAIGFDGAVYRNQDHVRIQGTEGALVYSRDGFGAEGFVRAQDARDLNAPDDPHGTPAAANRAFLSHGLKVFGGWSHVRLDLRYRTVGANYQWIGSYNCDNLMPNVVSTGVVYRELATTATLTLGKHWTLIARGEHLLQPKTSVDQWLAMQGDLKNDAYRAYGIPAPGPSASLEVVFRY